MGCLKTFAILTSVLVIGLSVYLYTPIPDGVGEPWTVRSIIAAGKLVKLVCIGSEMIGYSSCINITRTSISMFLPSQAPSKSDPQLEVTDTTFDGIKVRIYRPKTAVSPSPAMMYFHGGGWSLGSIETADAFTSRLAKMANIIVVSAQYRLAPEHAFPKPFEDCVAATLHLLHNFQQYGVDGKKIAVGGDSAGGNLAAAVTLLMSSNPNLPNITFQLVIQAPLQTLNFQLPSYTNSDNHLTLSPKDMARGWANYMGMSSNQDLPTVMLGNLHTSPTIKRSNFQDLLDVSLYKLDFGKAAPLDKDSGNETLWKEIENTALNPYVAPLLAHEILKTRPALVVTAQFDPLHDEGVMFAEQLRNGGIGVIHKNYKMCHGTLLMADLFEESQKAIKDIAKDVEDLFADKVMSKSE